MNKDAERERRVHTRNGVMEVVCGPMFSGKTEELIRRLRRAQIARQRVLVFKPQIDQRYAQDEVVSHSEQRILSVPVDHPRQMLEFLEKINFEVDVVGIDEAQFFPQDVSYLAEMLVSHGIRVIIAGLDQDYLGQPFGPIPDLLARADHITKHSAICVACGSPASKSQRIVKPATKAQETKPDKQVLVGGLEGYEARCRKCHVLHVDHPRGLPRQELVQEMEAFAQVM